MNPATAQYYGKQIYHVNSALLLKQLVSTSEQEAKPKPQIQNTLNQGKLKSAAGASCKQCKHQHFRPASQMQTSKEDYFPRHQAICLAAGYVYSPSLTQLVLNQVLHCLPWISLPTSQHKEKQESMICSHHSWR